MNDKGDRTGRGVTGGEVWVGPGEEWGVRNVPSHRGFEFNDFSLLACTQMYKNNTALI